MRTSAVCAPRVHGKVCLEWHSAPIPGSICEACEHRLRTPAVCVHGVDWVLPRNPACLGPALSPYSRQFADAIHLNSLQWALRLITAVTKQRLAITLDLARGPYS